MAATTEPNEAGGGQEPDQERPNAVRRAMARAGAVGQRYGARAIRWLVIGIILISAAVIGLPVHHARYRRAPRARRGRRRRTRRPRRAAFPLAVALLTGTPLAAGNRVELALNGDGTFPRLWADLRRRAAGDHVSRCTTPGPARSPTR